LKPKTIASAIALVAFAGFGLLVWRLAGPSGPARQLVGAWDVLGSDQALDDAVKAELTRKDPRLAKGVGDEFRSTERIRFFRNGECRHTHDLLGLTLTTEGTWRVTVAEDNALRVTFHQKKLSIRNQEGETKEEAKDATVEWVVSVVEADLLSVSMTDEGKTQRFSLRRARD
jgi:hypothetical protein